MITAAPGNVASWCPVNMDTTNRSWSSWRTVEVVIDMRQNSGTHRWMSVSDDQGNTWSPPYAGNNVSPVACAVERFSAKIAPDQRERILWTGPKGPERRTLVMRVSYDQGKTFQNERVISDEPAAYSDLTVLADNTIGCLWERGDYKYITFTRFDLSFVEPQNPSFAPVTTGTFTVRHGRPPGRLARRRHGVRTQCRHACAERPEGVGIARAVGCLPRLLRRQTLRQCRLGVAEPGAV